MDFPAAVTALGFLALIVGGWAYLRSSVVKAREEELENLVDTRGERISDLEGQVEEMRREIAELRGEVQALTNLKAKEIASEVVKAIQGAST